MLCKVIVDENVGPGSPVWEQFQRLFGETPVDYLYLKDVHRGIPDVEILDKLLSAENILLTGDCVLHRPAIYALRDLYSRFGIMNNPGLTPPQSVDQPRNFLS